jgi:hypothetical protein
MIDQACAESHRFASVTRTGALPSDWARGVSAVLHSSQGGCECRGRQAHQQPRGICPSLQSSQVAIWRVPDIECSYLVATEILSHHSQKERVKVIEFFIEGGVAVSFLL